MLDPSQYLRPLAVDVSYITDWVILCEATPGETTAIALARELDLDLLLAMSGKVSSELQTII